MKQAWLISYHFQAGLRNGFGRFVNYREDGKPPSFENIESMEKKIKEQNGVDGVCVLSVSRLADEE